MCLLIYFLKIDAVYGALDESVNFSNSIPSNCFVAINTPVWTVFYIGLIYYCDSS